MSCWRNKVVVVTDCGNEVGLVIMEKFVKAGMIAISFGISEDIIEKAANRLQHLTSKEIAGKVVLFKCDITNTVQLKDIFKQIVETYEGVDVLINNAFNDSDCLVNDGDLEKVKEIIDTNINALVACTRLAAKTMIDRKTRGHIININDLLAYDIPKASHKSVYIAAKAAVTSINEILRQEFRYINANVKVTNIALGDIENSDEPEFDKPKIKLRDVAKLIKLILNTPEHLQVHEILLEPVDEN